MSSADRDVVGNNVEVLVDCRNVVDSVHADSLNISSVGADNSLGKVNEGIILNSLGNTAGHSELGCLGLVGWKINISFDLSLGSIDGLVDILSGFGDAGIGEADTEEKEEGGEDFETGTDFSLSSVFTPAGKRVAALISEVVNRQDDSDENQDHEKSSDKGRSPVSNIVDLTSEVADRVNKSRVLRFVELSLLVRVDIHVFSGGNEHVDVCVLELLLESGEVELVFLQLNVNLIGISTLVCWGSLKLWVDFFDLSWLIGGWELFQPSVVCSCHSTE